MSLKEQFAQKLSAAKAAAEAGNIDQARTLRKEAETIKAAIDEMSALNGLAGQVPQDEPMRPALNGSEEAASKSFNGNTVVNGNGAGNGAGNGNGNNPVLEAAYQMRFKDTDSAIKGILKDIHGQDHANLYWAQKMAFNKYLRRGVTELSSDEYRLLKTVVYTPNAVKTALAEGYTDVSYLKATMVEASDSLGGIVVPVDINMNVIERLQGMTVMRGRARQMTTSRDRVEMPKSTGGDKQYRNNVRVTWVTESPSAGASATNLTFGQEAIPVHTVMATTTLSRNLLEDAAFNLEAYLTESFASALAMDEDNKFLIGDGVGKPQGILPGGNNSLALTEVASGSTGILVFDKLLETTFTIDAQYRQNAVWIMNKKTVLAIMQLKNSNNDYLWKPFQFGGAADGRPINLFGYPVIEQEIMPDVATGKYPILFGDPSAYMIVDRVGMTVERYLDGTTAEQNTIKFIMRRRVGGQLLENWKMIAHKVS